jgi:hypothetical protein
MYSRVLGAVVGVFWMAIVVNLRFGTPGGVPATKSSVTSSHRRLIRVWRRARRQGVAEMILRRSVIIQPLRRRGRRMRMSGVRGWLSAMRRRRCSRRRATEVWGGVVPQWVVMVLRNPPLVRREPSGHPIHCHVDNTHVVPSSASPSKRPKRSPPERSCRCPLRIYLQRRVSSSGTRRRRASSVHGDWIVINKLLAFDFGQ